MGKPKKKKRTAKRAVELTDDTTPRSFVFHRGDVGNTLMQLVTDIRHVMEPYTATNLKVTKSNVLKDFVHVAGPYGISHFMIFSKTEQSPYMRICRLPRGPTLTFKLHEYSLMKDVVAILRKPKTIGQQYRFSPLAVLNNFNKEGKEMKLTTTVFQNMFPSIKVHKIKLADMRRCVMFNYNDSDGTIDFRHYNIEAVPIGISRGVKKLLKNKIPNLGSLNNIEDLVTGSAYLSESEGEEPLESHVTLPQRVRGRGNAKSSQSAIKLTEMGPRLKIELIKIEEGVCTGEVLFHKYVEKSTDQIEELRKKKEKAKKLKEKRRKEQEDNIRRKEKEKEENKQRSLAGMKRKQQHENGEGTNENSGSDSELDGENEENKESDDDDREYFKDEIGEEPDQDLFEARPKKKRRIYREGDSKMKNTQSNEKNKALPDKNNRRKVSVKKTFKKDRSKEKTNVKSNTKLKFKTKVKKKIR